MVFDGLETLFSPCHSATAGALLKAFNNRKYIHFITLKLDQAVYQAREKRLQEEKGQSAGSAVAPWTVSSHKQCKGPTKGNVDLSLGRVMAAEFSRPCPGLETVPAWPTNSSENRCGQARLPSWRSGLGKEVSNFLVHI